MYGPTLIILAKILAKALPMQQQVISTLYLHISRQLRTIIKINRLLTKNNNNIKSCYKKKTKLIKCILLTLIVIQSTTAINATHLPEKIIKH